jgi:hypothetical protein
LPDGPVLELPFYDEAAGFEWHTVYLLASTRHWKRVVNGYGDFFPDEFVTDAPVLADFPSTDSLARLAQMDVRYVLVHFNLRGSPEPSTWEARVAPYRSSLDAVYEGDDAALYEITHRD